MAWSTAGRNQRANATAALIAAVGLHTGDPGGSGTSNEWTGGGYARQAPTYDAAASGIASLDAPMDFTGPASTTAAWFSLWGTGSVFLGSVQRTAGDAAANAAGEYSITQLDVDADADITA
jgi:hypothetical protein